MILEDPPELQKKEKTEMKKAGNGEKEGILTA
jgi:hypothetical protein